MKVYLVGGAVRDELLGIEPKEKDWVVVGTTPEDMLRLGYKQVGKEFPVFLHPKTGEEYALARMERKVAPGYAGFKFNSAQGVTLEEDLQRRDLTINAIAKTPEGQLIDPYHGQQDLKQKILRHISPAFEEDPVRILRIARFAARYAERGFTIAAETYDLMKKMVAVGEVDALVAERVWKELERALGEVNPEVFFEVLDKCGALAKLFPLLTAQEGLWLSAKSKGMKALRQAVKLRANTVIRFSVLLYDFPKKDITYLCRRYCLPTEYQDMALLVNQYYPECLQFCSRSAENILTIFLATDAFRRENRFNIFLDACSVIAESQNENFPRADIGKIYAAVKAVDVKELIGQGLKGAEIGAKLEVKRLRTIKNYFPL